MWTIIKVDKKEISVTKKNISKNLKNTNKVNQKELNRSISLFHGLEQIQQKQNIDAFAVRCWPEMFTEYGCASCGPMAMMNENKISSSCEADVLGSLTCNILNQLNNKPALLVDIVDLDEKDNTTVFWHCGLAPISMAEKNTPSATVHSNRKKPLLHNFAFKSGDITIDDQTIYGSTIESLRSEISMVSQETTLFDDTIKNNIAYANSNATDDEIVDAAKNAFADEFIDRLPDKYDTHIGENGVRLSGGEKQRLSIARAILKKTPIILLDEATSSLDSETENKIQKGLSFLTKNKTTLVIAHRLSTILNSEKIFVIDKGQLICEGTHKELLNNFDY